MLKSEPSIWRRERDSGSDSAVRQSRTTVSNCHYSLKEKKAMQTCKNRKSTLSSTFLFCSKASLPYGGGKGIRTLVGLHPNGFQDRLVMTTSISLRVNATIIICKINFSKCFYVVVTYFLYLSHNYLLRHIMQ